MRREDEGQAKDEKTEGKQRRWLEKYSGDRAFPSDYGLKNQSGIRGCQKTGIERMWHPFVLKKKKKKR